MTKDESWLQWVVPLVFVLIAALHVLYLIQFQATPLALVTPSGLDASFHHRAALMMLHGRVSDELQFASWYTYFVAFLYRLVGPHVEAVRIVQVILGVLSCGLVYRIAAELFGGPVATLALILYGFYGPALFYEGLLMPTSVGIFLSLLVAWQLVRVRRGAPLMGSVIAGIALAITCATIHAAYALIPFVTGWLYFRARSPRRGAAPAVALWAGLLGMWLLLQVPNLVWLKRPVVVPPHAGINFYIGNNPEAEGVFRSPLHMRASQFGLLEDGQRVAKARLGEQASAGAVNFFWFRKAFAFIVRQPLSWLELMAKKLVIVLNCYEPPDVEDYYFTQRFAPVLQWPLVTFSVIGPLALVGWVVSRGRRGASLPRLFVFALAAANILFFVTSRYRMPLVPYAAILAAYCVFWLSRYIASSPLSRLGLPIGLLVGAIVLSNLRPLRHSFAIPYYNLSIRYAESGHLGKAQQAALEAIRLNPRLVDGYFQLGGLAYRESRFEEARQYFSETIAKDPSYAKAYINLGLLDEADGRLEDALVAYRNAVALTPWDAQAQVNLGCAYAKTGHAELATRAFEEAARLRPDLPLLDLAKSGKMCQLGAETNVRYAHH